MLASMLKERDDRVTVLAREIAQQKQQIQEYEGVLRDGLLLLLLLLLRVVRVSLRYYSTSPLTLRAPVVL